MEFRKGMFSIDKIPFNINTDYGNLEEINDIRFRYNSVNNQAIKKQLDQEQRPLPENT